MLPDTVDFGGVPVGGDYFGKFVYFQNATGGPVVINSPYISGQEGNPFAWFSNLIGQFTIGDGSDLSYGVRFRPPWPGRFEDRLCVPVQDHPNPCVLLRGKGIERLEVPVFSGETGSAIVYLPNPGYRTLDVRIRSGAPWATPLPSFGLIPPGDSMAVTLALDAQDLGSGTYRDTLRVEAVGTYFDYELVFDLVVGTVLAQEDGGVRRVEVGVPYPNPARRRTEVPLTLSDPADVTVEVFTLSGRRALPPLEARYGAGVHTVGVEGGALATGVYLIRLTARLAGSGTTRTVMRRVVFVD